jgi:hypothetical protein
MCVHAPAQDLMLGMQEHGAAAPGAHTLVQLTFEADDSTPPWDQSGFITRRNSAEKWGSAPSTPSGVQNATITLLCMAGASDADLVALEQHALGACG